MSCHEMLVIGSHHRFYCKYIHFSDYTATTHYKARGHPLQQVSLQCRGHIGTSTKLVEKSSTHSSVLINT